MECSAHCAATDALFGDKVAAADLRRYRRRGPDPSTRVMLQELRGSALDGASLLDVGGGIGVLGLELQAAGVRQVTHVDASGAYLATARGQFAERGWSDRLRTVLGDFAALGEPLDPADLVTLHRVVCCYPDHERLLARAARCTRNVLAMSYPQATWYVRALFALENLWRRVTGSAFRAYVHPPERMSEVLERSGLRRVVHRVRGLWIVELYRRESVPSIDQRGPEGEKSAWPPEATSSVSAARSPERARRS
jgi:magnesium-protoporphyrin O-methyltransferase